MYYVILYYILSFNQTALNVHIYGLWTPAVPHDNSCGHSHWVSKLGMHTHLNKVRF
jgi:hypothetical protein